MAARSNQIDKLRITKYPLLKACIAEFCGTVILIIFGCGVLAQVKLAEQFKKDHGSFQSICWNWGMAVMLGVFFAGGNGHGNINPAISLAFAIIGKLRWVAVPCYMLCQLLGALIGALAVFCVYIEHIKSFAKTFDGGEYITNSTGTIFVTVGTAPTWNCFLDQVMGTALLAAGALAITDKKTWNLPDWLHPFFLGLLVFALVEAFGLNAGAALNPARDLGPRIAIAMLGWTDAFTQGDYYFWVPVIGPYVGAIIGALLYELTIGLHAGDAKKADEII